MILITGSNGFLGKYLSKIVAPEELCTLSKTNATICTDLHEKITVDLPAFDVVIHAAGKVHTEPKDEEEAWDFFAVNVMGTQHLLQAIEKTNVFPKAFVYISSVSVYGLEEGVDITEDAPLEAVTAYGKSKIAAEKIIMAWCKKHNVICTILRLPLLVGENAPGNLGNMTKAIQQGRYFNVDGGKARRSMVLAEDVANAVLPLSNIGGIYHLTDGYAPSFKEISEAIAQKIGKQKPGNIPLKVAQLLALGGKLHRKFPINAAKISKMTKDLIFNDDKARATGLWKPKPVCSIYQL